MANHKSALKEHRQSLKARLRNRLHKRRMRTAVKKLRTAVDSGDAAAARSLLAPALSLVDRTAKHGVIHRNAADRTKSRLTRAVQKVEAAS